MPIFFGMGEIFFHPFQARFYPQPACFYPPKKRYSHMPIFFHPDGKILWHGKRHFFPVWNLFDPICKNL